VGSGQWSRRRRFGGIHYDTSWWVSLLFWPHYVDVVKTRIQTGTRRSPSKVSNLNVSQAPLVAGFSSAPKNIRTESVITALRQVYEHEGWRGLFRGMGPRSGWCGCQSGVMFLGYEFFLRVLENWGPDLESIGS